MSDENKLNIFSVQGRLFVVREDMGQPDGMFCLQALPNQTSQRKILHHRIVITTQFSYYGVVFK